jgi:hypothetical protein
VPQANLTRKRQVLRKVELARIFGGQKQGVLGKITSTKAAEECQHIEKRIYFLNW